MQDRRIAMSDYTDEKFVKILRHLATQLPEY